MSRDRSRLPDSDDRLEDLVAECLERMDAEGSQAIDDVCRRHPEQADDVRRWLEVLARAGFHGAPPAVPDRIGGLRLIRRLGAGGMGVVYLAEDDQLKRAVAVKLIRPERLYFPGSRERFQREVEAVAKLKHQAIVPLYGVGIDRDIPYFSMELVEGCTLAEVLRELDGASPESLDGRSLAAAFAAAVQKRDGQGIVAPSGPLFDGTWIETCFRIAHAIAEALEHAHQHGVVHRDIKPSNIMITPQGQTRLFDFGLAHAEGATRLTLSGAQAGSLPYMAPEQLVSDRAQMDARTDVYSLGVSLYEMLTLRSPFSGDRSELVRRRILEGERDPIRHHNKRVPWDVETVCVTAMDRDPARRYRSAAGFARDLENVLHHRPIAAQPPAWTLRSRRWVERHPTLSTALVLMSLLVIGSTWFGISQASARSMLAEEQERTSKERDRANSSARELERSLHDLRRLSDSKLVVEHLAAAEGLWPPDPRRVAAIDAWLTGVKDLMARRPDHAALLERLGGEPTSRETATLPELTDADLRWQKGVLSELISDLGRLESLALEVERLRSRAISLGQATIESADAKAAWERARHAIAAHPAYRGLVLAPQLGLFPLGPNPHSGLWEFWHVLSGETPQRPNDGKSFEMTPEGGIVLVLIPGGEVRLGAERPREARNIGDPNVDPDAMGNESPVVVATIEPFFISKFEMTQCQWKRLTGSNPSAFVGIGDQPRECSTHPVETVGLGDCRDWLHRWSLVVPTEAQWECAARGGTTTVWWTGDGRESIVGAANIADKALQASGTAPRGNECEDWIDDGHAAHAPVGSFRPNPYGLHDTMGNVFEWCRDPNAVKDPHAGSASAQKGATRGGGYRSGSHHCRSGARATLRDDARVRELGVRPARAVTR